MESVKKFHDRRRNSYWNFSRKLKSKVSVHQNDIKSIVLIQGLLVSVSNDTTIHCVDVESLKSVHEIVDFERPVNDLVLWDETSFFACSRDHFIRGYHVIGRKIERVFTMEMFDQVGRIARVHETDILACTIIDKGIGFVDVRKNIVLRTVVKNQLSIENISWYQKLISSKKHPMTVYISCWDPMYDALMIEVSSAKAKQMYVDSHGSGARGLAVMENVEGDELLFVGCGRKVTVYNTKNSEKTFAFKLSRDCQFLRFVNDNFLFVGGTSQQMSLFHIDTVHLEACLILQNNVLAENMWSVLYDAAVTKKTRNTWNIAFVGTCKSYEIHEFFFEFDDNSEEDLKERILYVYEEREVYFGDILDRCFLNVRLRKVQELKVPKSFLFYL